ncbi:MAG: hypothetical protein GY711_27730 [bacterium]|nr:hypothetical protein [bacterium]
MDKRLALLSMSVTIAVLLAWTTELLSPALVPQATVAAPDGFQAAGVDRARTASSAEPEVRRTELRAATDAPRTSRADAADTTEPQASELLASWDRIVASFRTDTPQTQQFNDLLLTLAANAEIVAGSVQRDEVGVIGGELRIPGADLEGSFHVSEEGYVSLGLTRAASGDGFVGSEVSVGFPLEEGGAYGLRSALLSRPDLEHASEASLGANGERLTGWSLDVDPAGTAVEPIVLARHGARGWRIGASESIATVQEPGAYDVRAHDQWRSVLDPYLD